MVTWIVQKEFKEKIQSNKYYLSSLLRKIPFSHLLLGIPLKRISSSKTQNYFRTQNNKNTYLRYLETKKLELKPAYYLNKKCPQLISPVVYNYEHFLLSLNKGKYCHIHISIITKEGYQLALASNHPTVTLKEHPIFSKLILPKVRKYSGVGLLLSTPNDNNYFHCLFQIAPKIWFLDSIGEIKEVNHFLLEVSRYSFQMEIIKTLGINPKKIINLSKQKYVEVEQILVTPTFTRPEPWICLKLRELFLSSKIDTCSWEKIFVSRNGAKYRRFAQEEELVTLLNKLGFKVLSTEGMTILEQAHVFNKAKVIVGVHGAGLANIVFCEPSSKILELRAENHQEGLGTVYEHLSSICQLRHFTYLCQEVKITQRSQPKFSDLKVDLADFATTLKKFLLDSYLSVN